MEAEAKSTFSVEQDDGVCFSAGHTGAPFGAGFIHAYLASDRKPPVVVAGISLGAVTAAVMERSYRDSGNPETSRRDGAGTGAIFPFCSTGRMTYCGTLFRVRQTSSPTFRR